MVARSQATSLVVKRYRFHFRAGRRIVACGAALTLAMTPLTASPIAVIDRARIATHRRGSSQTLLRPPVTEARPSGGFIQRRRFFQRITRTR
jgi:hypothetical protein